jgi:hypothetical protein
MICAWICTLIKVACLLGTAASIAIVTWCWRQRDVRPWPNYDDSRPLSRGTFRQ